LVIKRIDKNQLEIGMFVEAIEGPWQNDSSVGRRFVVKDATQLASILNGKVSGVFINTALGNNTVRDSSARPASKSMKSATKEEKLLVAQQIHSQADETRTLLQGVFEGKDISIDAFTPLADDVGRTMDENPSLFMGMSRLRSRDTATFVHSLSVAALLVHFARSLDMDEKTVQLLCIAGLLHDVGKLAIPIHILHKQGPLDAEERIIVQNHTEQGHRILKKQEGMPQIVLDICLSHHERLDGKGYPNGIKSNKISNEVRMSTICDVFDALTSARSYKKGWSSQQALTWMMAHEEQFDRTLLRRFIISLDPEMTKGVI